MRKIINWIKTHKKIVGIFVILFLIILFVLYFFLKDKKTPLTPKEHLRFVTTVPAMGEYKAIWSVQKFKFIFSEKIDQKTIKYSVSPYTRTRLITSEGPSSELEIIPLDGWKENIEYTITISKTLSSLDGKNLKDNVVFKIRRIVPQPNDPEYPAVIDDEHAQP